MKRIRVWDLPTRIVHWTLVILVLAAYLTQEFDLMQWHQRIGLALLGLLVFRLVWGFVGSTHARFTQFVRGPGAVIAYLRGRWQGVGHNPLGAGSVLALLLLPLAMVATGLFANDDVAFRGLLAGQVSNSMSESLTGLHETIFDLLLIFIGVHVAAIAFYAWVRRENLIRPMFSGYTTVGDAHHAETPRGGGWLAFAFAVALAVGAVVAVLQFAPAEPTLPADYQAPDW